MRRKFDATKSNIERGSENVCVYIFTTSFCGYTVIQVVERGYRRKRKER